MSDNTTPTPANPGAGAPRVLVFTATYNEKDNIERLCAEVLALPLDVSLMVVDDNSPDGTGDLLNAMAARDPRITVIHRPRKLGLGTAHKLAMAYAAKRDIDVLVTMDADFSHNPADIPRLVQAVETADFAVGSRYMEGGSCDYEGYRLRVSQAANKAARILLGIPLHEMTTSFRAFRVSMLRTVDFPRIQSQGYSFFLECVWQISRAGFRVTEIPIHFADRVHGQSKIPRHEIWTGLRKLMTLFLRRLRGWRRWRVPSQPAEGHCLSCGSDLLVEMYPARRRAEAQGAAAYRCTSMEHGSKPQVIRCLCCGLVAAGHAPSAAELIALYGDVADTVYLENRAGRERTFSSVLKEVESLAPRKGRLLEVGAYCGIFLQAAQTSGWTAEGVEPSRWAVGIARESGLNIHAGTLQENRCALSPPYDVAVMWDVLEHLNDPIGELKHVRELMADDALLFVSTLDIDGWWPQLLGPRWPWIMDMHLFYPSIPGLRDLFGRAGFELIEVRPYRHHASLRYLADKVSALLPAPLGWLAGLAGRLMPRNRFLEIHLGDVKLFVCRKAPLPPSGAVSSTIALAPVAAR